MDALTIVENHLDVAKILEHYNFDKVSSDGEFMRACCKIHGGDNPSSFVINQNNGLYYCHTNCGGGDIFTLVQSLEEINFPNAVQRVADILGVDIENLQITERKSKTRKELENWIKTMKNWSRKKKQQAYHLDVPIREVLEFRKFKQETLRHFQLGFVDTIKLEKKSGGFYELHNRLVVPIIQDGIQVGVSLRSTKAKDYPKWSHQPRNIKTSDLIYNYDEAKGKPSIVVTEGAFDVWAFHEIGVTAVATYGAHITEEQYKLLMKTGADLIFAYDGDEAGRNATQKARELFRYKANMEYIIFDEGEDPASIDREQLKTKYESREKLC